MFSGCTLYPIVVLPPDGIPDVKWNKIPATDALGSFEMLLDEELAAQGDSGQGLLGSTGSGGGVGPPGVPPHAPHHYAGGGPAGQYCYI